MKLTKEPKEIDFIIKSEPWSEEDSADFSVLIQKLKSRNKRRKISAHARSTNQVKPKNQKRMS